jgi:Xaa-Pro aminopeptidase
MLQRTAAAGAALPLAHTLINSDADAQGQTPLPAFTVSSPTFSLAERDRRWAAVRANMAKPGWNLDAIITPSSDGVGNNARYLTQIVFQRTSNPAPEVLFPRDPAKAVFAHISSARHVEEWGRRLGPGRWLSDGKLVLKAESGAEALAKRLTAEGYNRPGARIGVAKLKGSRFDPDGLASATWLDELKTALPGVLFLPIDQFPPKVGNDAGPIEEASMSKSAEEIAMIRKSVAITERAITAAIAAARNGATRQADLWWACYQVQYTSTGEEPIRCSLACDVSSANALLGDPTDLPVKPGQICVQETSTAYQGYGCQINHPFFIGSPSTPGYEYYRTAVELLAKVIERAIAFIQPGKTIGEFQANNEKIFKELGEKGSGLNVHGSGIGYLSRPRQSEGDNILIMQPGFAFDFKPGVALDRAKIKDVGEKNRSLYMGEAILVTDKGAERLSTRKLVPIATNG